MELALRKKLVFHSAMVILLGMLSGIPLAMVLLGYMDGHAPDWKLSHMEGLINGLLMLAIAACGGLLTLSTRQVKLLYLFALVTGYGNAFYGWVRGFSGETGLDFAPPVANQLAALLGGIPIFTALGLIVIVMIGARNQ